MEGGHLLQTARCHTVIVSWMLVLEISNQVSDKQGRQQPANKF
ncbi:hypothetical protein DAI22_06g017600 [Oryza sativa Japonica Group]|nr:hypothetical protein DAI22_06g017600 [Oryza sativa Japonica Group]